jgi:restriction system protein
MPKHSPSPEKYYKHISLAVPQSMAVPDYQTVMLPLLKLLADGETHNIADLAGQISEQFELTEEEREERIPSGTQRLISNRVGWAKSYLKASGLVEQPKRAFVRITDEGKNTLALKPERIDNAFLRRFPSFLEFTSKAGNGNTKKPGTKEVAKVLDEAKATPEESLEQSYASLRNALAADILEQVKSCTPAFLEQLVVELLVAMGYGGSVEDAGKAIGQSGDGGIDGVIKEDKLGLDVVVVQAKRWESNTVGRPEIQAFAGSMEPFRARKGVFITTSQFAQTAYEYVKQIERKIVLIDGPMLARLMIDHGIGVTPYKTYALKRLDTDFFEE